MNFISSGKKGDLIMSLHIMQRMGGGNLYITEGEFEETLDSVMESCGKLISSQDYIRSFAVYDGEQIDVNLDNHRTSRAIWGTTLLELKCRAHGLNLPKDVKPWINVPPDEKFISYFVIHRRLSAVKERENSFFDWDVLLSTLGPHNCVFVSRLESEYNDFNRPDVEYYKPKDNYEHACIIKGARFFIGNQSFPAALADSLGVNRIFELSSGLDRKHFAVNYADNAWYFASPLDATIINFRYLVDRNGENYFDLKTNKTSTRKPGKNDYNLIEVFKTEAKYHILLRWVKIKNYIKYLLDLIPKDG